MSQESESIAARQKEAIWLASLEGKFWNRWLDLVMQKNPNLSGPPSDLVPLRQFKITGSNYVWDFAWPPAKVLVECQGAQWKPRSGHRSATGLGRDCRKLCTASAAGFLTFAFSTDMLEETEWYEKLYAAILSRMKGAP